MKNSQRATTARIDGGGDTTAFAACAFALDAEHSDAEGVGTGGEVPVDFRHGAPGHRVDTAADCLQRNLELEGMAGHDCRRTGVDVPPGPVDDRDARQLRIGRLAERDLDDLRRHLDLGALGRDGALRQRVRDRREGQRHGCPQSKRRRDGKDAPRRHAYLLRRRNPIATLSPLSMTATMMAMIASNVALDALFLALVAAVAADCALARAVAAR